jgi:hypothetical protein
MKSAASQSEHHSKAAKSAMEQQMENLLSIETQKRYQSPISFSTGQWAFSLLSHPQILDALNPTQQATHHERTSDWSSEVYGLSIPPHVIVK